MHRLGSRFAPVAIAVLLTGCSAGQVAQTARQISTVDGVQTDIGPISLRDVSLEYPSGGEYEPGDDVRLLFVVVNRDATGPDNLLSVSSELFSGESNDTAGLPAELPAGADVSFTGDGLVVELSGLTEPLLPTMRIPVTFSFEQAGEATVRVPVAVSLEYVEGGAEPYDFNAGQ